MYSDLGFQGIYLTPSSLGEIHSGEKVKDTKGFGKAAHADFILELMYHT